jgi:hypothetical protein
MANLQEEFLHLNVAQHAQGVDGEHCVDGLIEVERSDVRHMEVAEVLSLQANTNSVLARVGLDQQIEDVSLDHLGFVDHTVVKVQEIDALVMLTEDLLQKAWA